VFTEIALAGCSLHVNWTREPGIDAEPGVPTPVSRLPGWWSWRPLHPGRIACLLLVPCQTRIMPLSQCWQLARTGRFWYRSNPVHL